MNLKLAYPPSIFEDPGDPGHVYRGIHHKHVKLLEMLNDLDVLVDFDLLQDTIKVGKEVRRLARIKRVPADIRIQELTKKQAKRLLCDQMSLCLGCLKRGICLTDISESNILYWAGQSYYVDLGSFSLISNDSMAYSYVKMSYMINKYLGDKNSVGSSIHASHKTIKSYNDWSSNNYTNKQTIELWERYRDYVYGYNIPEAKETHWSKKYACDAEKLKENKKLNIINNMLRDINGYSVLDVGTNKGYLLNMLKDRFERLIGFDCDNRCIDIAEECYGDHKTTFVKFGIEDSFGDRTDRPHRYKSDLVLALAVTHHFATNNIDTGKCAQAIADMSNKMILIEDINNDKLYNDTFIKNGFKLVKEEISDPPGRKLLLWSKS